MVPFLEGGPGTFHRGPTLLLRSSGISNRGCRREPFDNLQHWLPPLSRVPNRHAVQARISRHIQSILLPAQALLPGQILPDRLRVDDRRNLCQVAGNRPGRKGQVARFRSGSGDRFPRGGMCGDGKDEG